MGLHTIQNLSNLIYFSKFPESPENSQNLPEQEKSFAKWTEQSETFLGILNLLDIPMGLHTIQNLCKLIYFRKFPESPENSQNLPRTPRIYLNLPKTLRISRKQRNQTSLGNSIPAASDGDTPQESDNTHKNNVFILFDAKRIAAMISHISVQYSTFIVNS